MLCLCLAVEVWESSAETEDREFGEGERYARRPAHPRSANTTAERHLSRDNYHITASQFCSLYLPLIQ